MAKRRLYVLEGKRMRRSSDCDFGRLIYRNDSAAEACRRRKGRNRWGVLGIQFTVALFVLAIIINNEFWGLLVFLAGALIILAIPTIPEISLRRNTDVLPALYEHGVLTRDVASWWVVEMFYPYHQIKRTRLSKYHLVMYGTSKAARWIIVKEDLGEEGIEMFHKLKDGHMPPSGPPELILYGGRGAMRDRKRPPSGQ